MGAASAMSDTTGRSEGTAEARHPRPARVFISYRREETSYAAGWLFDRLEKSFGEGQVFKDVDSIQPGDDFSEVIAGAVGACDALLALIGDEWLTITDAAGRPRLNDPHDFVRLEIESALERGISVIPVVVEGARMPTADELPGNLAPLAGRQAVELSPSRFEFDFGRLLRALERRLGEAGLPQAGPAVPADAPGGAATGPDRAAAPSARAADGVPHGDGDARRRLRVAAIAAPALVAVGLYLLFSPASPNRSPEGDSHTATAQAAAVSSELLGAVPERNRPCERGTGAEGFWMRDLGAQEQANCRLAANQSTPSLVGGSLSYGRFASAAAARAGLGDSESFGISGEDAVRCDRATLRRMHALYSDGRATCLRRADRGLIIEWNDDGSSVMGHMTYDAPTSTAAALRSWSRTI
jgi:TIR domain-containing protein